MFQGVISWNEILEMPIPLLDKVVEARLKQLEESHELYKKTGQVNLYTQPTDANNALGALGSAFAGAAEASKEARNEDRKNNHYVMSHFMQEYRKEFQQNMRNDSYNKK